MKGGSVNFFPLPDTITTPQQLEEQVSFLNVVGHGGLSGQVFKVPENTFILFMGTAGYPIIRRPTQQPILKRYRFLNPGETKEQWYARTFKSIKDKTFFSDILYRNNAPYEEFKTAIYEPGDILQDLVISFVNPEHPFMLLGVWNCPIPTKLGTDFDKNNGEFEVVKHEYIDTREKIKEALKHPNSLNDMTIATLASQQDDLEHRLEKLEKDGKAIQDHLPSDPNNYASRMGLADWNRTTLSEVLQQLKRTPMSDKSIRFIVVEACRSITLEHGGIGTNVLQSVMRAVKENMPLSKQAARIPEFREYEREAQKRRRPSLLARRGVLRLGNLGGAVGGSGSPVVSLVPSFTYNIENLKRVASSISKKTKIGGIEANQLVTALEQNRPVPLDALEELFNEYTKSGYNLMTKNIQTMMSGLAPEHKFKPGEFVEYHDESGVDREVFIVGAKNEGGVIEFDVVYLDETGSPIRKTINPLALRRLTLDEETEEKKAEIEAILKSLEFDLGAEIAKIQAEQVLEFDKAREAYTAFSASLGSAAPNTTMVGGPSKQIDPFGWGFMIESSSKAEYDAVINELNRTSHVRPNKIVHFKKPSGDIVEVEVTSHAKFGPIPSKTNTALYPTVQVRLKSGATPFVKISDLVPKSAGGGRGKSRSTLSGKLCRCIKQVRKTVKVRKGSKGGKESAAIGICVRSVLGKRGRTLRKFRCDKKPYVETQDPLKR